MNDEAVVKRHVPLRVGRIKQEHDHGRAPAVYSLSKVPVVLAAVVLRYDFDSVMTPAAAAEVVGLHVPRGLVEAEIIQQVMVFVRRVEDLRHARG